LPADVLSARWLVQLTQAYKGLRPREGSREKIWFQNQFAPWYWYNKDKNNNYDDDDDDNNKKKQKQKEKQQKQHHHQQQHTT